MSTKLTAATAAVVAALTSKESRKRFGIKKTPLVVPSTATAYRKVMPFDEQFAGKISTHSWVVEDPNRGLMIRANTYDGNLGDRVDYLNSASTAPIPAADSKDRKKALKGYEVCPLNEVPFVMIEEVPAEEPTTPPTEETTPEATTEDVPAAEA